jgi:hypothetical protein
MTQSIAYYNGFRLIETTAITKQVQRRTHHKRRINKKWLKKYGRKTVLDDGRIIQFGDCIFATPKTIKKIIAATKGE